jgi:hypothetical protein
VMMMRVTHTISMHDDVYHRPHSKVVQGESHYTSAHTSIYHNDTEVVVFIIIRLSWHTRRCDNTGDRWNVKTRPPTTPPSCY